MKFSASVVVPTRGGIDRLPRLVECLSKQSRSDFETIFVIDGDTDGSTQYLRSSAVTGLLPNSEVITFSENRGRSEALNSGHERATGEVLIRCDDDLAPSPDYIESHVARQDSGPQGTIGLYKNVFPGTPYATAYGIDSDLSFTRTALSTSSDMCWRYWAGNVSIPREIWQEVGPYDTKFRTYGWEDVDYGYRIHAAGYPVVIAPELTTLHHVAAVTTKIRVLRALHSGAARETFVAAHGPEVLPVSPTTGLWNTLVSGVSKISTERTLDTAAGVVDNLLPRIPKRIGTKLVALLVESAGTAGINYPARAKSNF